MALTPTEFKARKPEFSEIADSLIQEKLDKAARSMGAEEWGDLFDDGQEEHTAVLLAMTPEGQEAGLRAGGGANQRPIYQAEWDRLRRLVGGANRAVLP
jgi:hypothetical protein